MGIYDRDYYREPVRPPRTPVGGVRVWSVTTWLIVINIAVFVIDNVVRLNYYRFGQWRQDGLLTIWGHFSVELAIYQMQLWRFITFQFLHANLIHLLLNMFGLYFFGPLIEMYLGSRRYLAFYLLCGIAGAVGYMVLWAASGVTVVQLQVSALIPLVGASAGIFGILIGAAQIAPDATVLVYGFFPVRLRAAAWVLLAVAVMTILRTGPNAGGEAAHLGGAVLGWLLIRNPQVLNLLIPPERRRMQFR
jgi:membrane associated rhomboid family serine protease